MKKEATDIFNPTEIAAIFQLFRILNALNYHLGLIVEIQKTENNLYNVFAKLEEMYIIASSIKESIKVLYGKSGIFIKLYRFIGDDEVKAECEDNRSYYDGYRTNTNLLLLELIRNHFSFHFRDTIYEGFIREGESQQDLKIGISKSNMLSHSLYLAPVDSMLNRINRFIVERKLSKVPDQLLSEVINEEIERVYKNINDVLKCVLRDKVETRIEEQ